MESSYFAGFIAGNKAIWRTSQVDWSCIAESFNSTAASDGSEWAFDQKGVCGGTAESRVYLTELGYSLKPILDAMSEWGENYQNMKEKEV